MWLLEQNEIKTLVRSRQKRLAVIFSASENMTHILLVYYEIMQLFMAIIADS